ncbi:MAG: sugar phosphate isomerase/epimerase family protein [Hungatella hathewayi]|uniref:sugar phosphate isomerase/epimerase family protein n=1 Tax=Hungatella TaxID=1649459 RepID=UPI001107168D|nr:MULTISPECIES: sugar phosphate isomerase/epimerase family protein [Hungatella]MCI7381082.1 sugar phosphate isomerase/epimerase [Hungatella sp.]MDY6237338.1 sugar phosphate isomerase/epimerase family protein [Hungatella hathewayi]
MKIATTGTTSLEGDILVYHGEYKDIIPRISYAGYEAVELHISDSSEIDREKLWKLLTDYHVSLTSIGTGAVYEAKHYNLGDHDRRIRRAAIQHLKQHMITAQPFHALVIIGLAAGRFSDADSPEEFKKNLTDSLHHLDELAEGYDISLGLEIMNRFESDYLTTIAQGIDFLKQERFQRILLHIDTVHMNIEEADIGKAIRQAKGCIGHVHVSDNDRYYPGHGHYNFYETLKALYDIGYDGTLALETNRLPDTETSAGKSLIYLNRMIDRIERENMEKIDG